MKTRLLLTLLLWPTLAFSQASVGLRVDHSTSRNQDSGRTGSSASILLLRAGYDPGDFSLFAEVPFGFYSVSDEERQADQDEESFSAGNLVVELGRVISLGRRVRADTRLKLYLPTLPESEKPGQRALTRTAALVRPEESPMWTEETFTAAPRMDLVVDLSYWLEFSVLTALYQTLGGDESTTYLHVAPKMQLKVAGDGRLGVAYGVFDRIDKDADGLTWIALNGGFDKRRIQAGLEVRLRQSNDEYRDALGTQFALYVGGRF